ncbi:hypothetical protein HRD49_13730 [Corallococcus exiguus]|uniref:hypothetical protein n=2 Tax=Corallococcus TaxID=83461 RepID=UPI000EA0C0A3|nr:MULTISPECIES: hypothetical protein [Corallococcus]NNC15850.1 hypothetical protein [Corallococcus exiguus]NRD62809.1 hypothetical protein [Corallococcus exiguus]RKH29369.1 hypothetical protein D7V77_06220 [Corallococcus sp. CA041A]
MRTLQKSLLAALAVVSLSPAAALAAKPQCEDICYERPCSMVCDVWGRTTTCAENAMFWGCVDGIGGSSDSSAPATPEAVQQADASAQVCSEQNPAAEQSAAVES